MGRPDTEARRLQSVFEQIARTRMRGLPLCHPELSVQCVGFREWQGRLLGILVTPWSMNLVLLPAAGEDWADLQPGSKQVHELPAGAYEFVVGQEPAIGDHQLCSLFSPMFVFADQDAAVATATAAMTALLDAETREDAGRESDGGTGPNLSSTQATPAQQGQPLSARLERPLSRRELLRGAFLRETP